ncbi:MAG: carboxypeptidase regulatory-like domain-containing protein [Planctomycetes bacterium]|nr:carboxypeptidase regulatory-like domain-containing protein [Planctomycetota bacterium]
MFRRILQGGVWLALVACLAGCPQGGEDGDYPASAPVTGTVTYNSSPVEGATVMFTPASGSGFSSFGVTDAKGNFALKTQWGADGAVPGSYKASVSKTESKIEDVEGSEANIETEEEGAAPSAITDHLPVRYKSPETADLPVEVKADVANNFPLDLTD